MAIPPLSHLDANQAIVGAYDEEQRRLRVDTLATITAGGAFEVSINYAEDSISIGDDGNFLTINPDGSIDVNVINSSAGGELTAIYDEIDNVSSNILTTINNFTVGSTSKLRSITASGSNIGTYQLEIDGDVIVKKRTYFGNSLDLSIDFPEGLPLAIGQILEFKVIHERPYIGDFNASFFIQEFL